MRGGRRKALAGAGLLLLPLLLLFGCTRDTTGPAELIISAAPGQHTVIARVIGVKGDLYHWKWGDGQEEETQQPQASHTYTSLDVYVVTVQVIRYGQSGDGGPGPGTGVSPVVAAELTTTVDIRYPVELRGIEVVVLDPPPWYDPESWPVDCYPASCNLKIYALLRYNRSDAPKVARVYWQIFDEFSFVFDYEGDPLFFPYDKFIGPSCGSSWTRRAYRINCNVFLSDGTVLTLTHTIYACPPKGCGG